MVTNKGNSSFVARENSSAGCSSVRDNPRLSANDKFKLKLRDQYVSEDPFGIKKKGSAKEKANVVQFLQTKYKQKYRDMFIKKAREENLNVQHVEDLFDKELAKAVFEGATSSKHSESLLRKTHTALDGINNLTDGVESATNSIKQLFHGFKAGFPTWVRSLCAIIVVSEVIANLTYRYRWDNTAILLALGSILCLEIADDNSWTQRLLVRFQNFGKNDDEGTAYVPQSSWMGDTATLAIEVASLVVPFVISITGYRFLDLSKEAAKKTIDHVAKFFTSFSRMKSGVSDMITASIKVISFVSSVIKWAFVSRKMEEFPEWDTPWELSSLTVFTRKVEDFVKSSHNGKMLINQKTYLDICDMIVEGDELVKSVPVRDAKLAIFHKIKELKLIRESLVTKGVFSSGSRPEPVALVLCGPPGQGKSTVCQLLHTLIWSNGMMPTELQESFEKDPMKFMFTRVSANDFWEGYSPSHFTAVWDDIGALREEFSGISEFIEIIKAVNSFPFALHMAEMMSKANTYFTSRLVVASSNIIGDWNSKALFCQDALARRMNKNRYKVTLKDDFPAEPTHDPDNPIRRFDVTKAGVQNLLTLADVKFEKWEKGKWVAVPWNYLVNDIRKQLREAQDSYDRQMQHLRMVAASVEPDFPDDYKEWVSRVEKAKKTDPATTIEFMDFSKSVICMDNYEELSAKFPDVDPLEYEDLFVDSTVKDEETVVQTLLRRIRIVKREAECWIGKHMFKPVIDMDDLDDLESVHSDAVVDVQKFNKKEWQPWVKYAIGAGSLATAAGIAGILYTWLGRDKKYEGELETGYKARSVKHNGVGVQKIPNVSIARAVYEGGTIDPQATDILKKTLRYNTYAMSCGSQTFGYITFVEDRFAVFPAHFIFYMGMIYEKASEMERLSLKVSCKSLVSSNSDFEILVVDFFQRCVQHETKDLALVHFGNHTTSKKSIVKRIASIKDKKAMRGVIVIPEVKDSDKLSWVSNINLKYNSGYQIDFGPHILNVGDLVSYNDVKTVAGDCGSLIFSTSPPRNERPIIGFHIGSGKDSPGGGIGLLLNIEDYEMLKQCLNEQHDIFEIDEEEVTLPESEEETILGVFQSGWKSPKAYRGCDKSSIRKSPVFGDWGESNYTPARLRPFYDEEGNLINPFEKAVLAYSAPKVPILEMLVAKSAESLGSWLQSQSPVACPFRAACINGERDNMILEFDEAVLGVEGDNFFKSISRKSSPGYPHVLENLPHGKAAFFGDGQDFDLTTHRAQRLKAKVYESINKARRGVRCLWVYTDNLKDERVTFKKASIGKTRLFSACPLELLLMFRMYFGAFASWVARNHVHNGIAIGLNTYGNMWDLAGHLIKQNENSVFAGDFKFYDKGQVPLIHNHILGIINHWYDDGNDHIREVLWLEITNSRHIYLDEIYTWHGSLPSGNPLTSLVNSLYNHMLFRMCWYYRQLSNPCDPLEPFNENVYLLVMGDDNVGSTRDPRFDPAYIAETMKVFGQEWTHESKEEEVGWGTPFRSVSEVSFLKRTWRYDEQLKRYVGPLSLATVLEICYWYRSGNDPAEQIANNMETVLRELSLHPPDVWDTYAPSIRYHIQLRSGYRSKYATRSEYLIACSNSEFVL